MSEHAFPFAKSDDTVGQSAIRARAQRGQKMRVVVAPDKFKGSLEAAEVAAALAAGLRVADPDLQIDEVPVADGGEGTVDAALASGYHPVAVTVTGPTGDPVVATIAVADEVAVVEMATASGLGVLPVGDDGVPHRDALGATSRGTGELIAAALDAGCRTVVLGVGGSACTDGGAGLAQALGVRLLTADDDEVGPGGGALAGLDRVDLSGLDPRVAETTFVLAADVTNPLLGPDGAAVVFGPQKGASASDVALLEVGLGRWAQAVADALDVAVEGLVEAPGAGAAGGVGFAALALLDAEKRSGIDVVLDLVRLDDRLAGADVVITGEGSLDGQSLGGKTPIGVARRARNHGVATVIAVCGRSLITADQATAAGFDAVHALADREPDPERSMREAASLLLQVGEEIARTWSTPAVENDHHVDVS